MALREVFSSFTYDATAGHGRNGPHTSLQSFLFAAPLVVAVLGLLYVWVGRNRLISGFPLVRADETSKYSFEKAQAEWNVGAHKLIEKGIEQVKGAFQVVTAIGPRIILPNKFADEIRNDPHLNSTDAINREFFGDYPGFEAFAILKERDIFQEAIRIRLTQSLNFVTEDLASEARAVCTEAIPQSKEWRPTPLKPLIMDLVARVSQRVFVGPRACRDAEWLAITKRYTVDAFGAARELRAWSPLLRPWAHRFLPSCRRVRADLAAARRIVGPVVEARREEVRLGRERERAEGKKAGGGGVEKVADAVGWLEESARGRPFDHVCGQLAFAVAATFTTTELTSVCVLNLCAYPEYVEPLRREIVEVMGEGPEGEGGGGEARWRKAALQRLRLMDSFIKESQRLQHEVRATMTRLTRQAVTLSDGTTLPKNALIMVGTDMAMDPAVFPDPHAFNGRRFLEMRERPGQQNRWQLATTSPEHLGFGHGAHACPGRFFAANEVKVLLVFLLMRHDWKLPEGVTEKPELRRWAHEKFVDLEERVMVRRRDEEIEL
ncbi:cytochrome p450 [Diplodia corticola]|uniref:Cytochrome p450 n=1 Tax=Diplodia corticola TaxID=236234 RepID=A0A1J9RUJ0_9PEZI|nr:cytochrome p450 [Diplodia corticola]OJD36251.1 cytochrome p450 [Diplodia corticola]